jgi:hypothetical protein
VRPRFNTEKASDRTPHCSGPCGWGDRAGPAGGPASGLMGVWRLSEGAASTACNSIFGPSIRPVISTGYGSEEPTSFHQDAPHGVWHPALVIYPGVLQAL